MSVQGRLRVRPRGGCDSRLCPGIFRESSGSCFRRRRAALVPDCAVGVWQIARGRSVASVPWAGCCCRRGRGVGSAGGCGQRPQGVDHVQLEVGPAAGVVQVQHGASGGVGESACDAEQPGAAGGHPPCGLAAPARSTLGLPDGRALRHRRAGRHRPDGRPHTRARGAAPTPPARSGPVDAQPQAPGSLTARR